MSGESIIRQGKEVFLQAFNWESHKINWWLHLEEKIQFLAETGFSSLWLPPPSNSLAPQGYLPKDYYCLDSAYGNETELRELLKTIQSNGLRAMADIVINHRAGTQKGSGGHYNRYDGSSMPWDEKAVTCDTGGHGNPSTGETFPGVSNIDHTQEFVRKDLIQWLQWLITDVGFKDLRFDYAKGYKPEFVKEYIEAVNPEFCVGEYWDSCNYSGSQLEYDQDSHRQRIVDWLDRAGGLSAAFDFTTKAILQEALKTGEMWRLRDSKGKPSGVVGMWPSRSVTFIENHDTGSTQAHWPFPREHILKGYAYILTHPGQPMVFYDHYFDWGSSTQEAIRRLIAIRKRQGLHSRSSVRILEAKEGLYAAAIDEKVCMKIGPGSWYPHWDRWKVGTSGHEYAVWEKEDS